MEVGKLERTCLATLDIEIYTFLKILCLPNKGKLCLEDHLLKILL